MKSASVAVRIEAAAWRIRLPGAAPLVRSAATAALEGETSSLTVLLAGDEAMRRLNLGFRGKDAPTNVLAFPALANPEDYLGDIALGLGVCEAEARDQAKSLSDHVRHLVVHGVLHLRGFDHDLVARAAEMEGRERQLLAGLGVEDPYREVADARSAV